MHLLRNRPLAIAYWVAALVLSVLAGVGGGAVAQGWAPQFSDEGAGAPATSGAQLLYGVVGGLLAGLAVLALFAGVWLLLWARERRHQEPDWDDADDDMEDLLVDEDGERFS